MPTLETRCVCVSEPRNRLWTPISSHLQSPAELSLLLLPKVNKRPAASYQGASSLTCRQRLPNYLSPLLHILFFLLIWDKYLWQFWWYRTRCWSETLSSESFMLKATSFGCFWPAIDCYLQPFLCHYPSPEPSGPCCKIPADVLINQSNRAVHIKYTAEAAGWCLLWTFYFSLMFKPS